jgi:hypothetical protein
MHNILHELPDTEWLATGPAYSPTHNVEPLVESGKVLVFPHLAFALSEAERVFLHERWADPESKNISVRWPSGELRGAVGNEQDKTALHAMITRYAQQAEDLALRLFPHYQGKLQRGNSSFRPAQIAGRKTSWRKDDSRLHVDAFPSNPTQGTRLLRVFCNVNPQGEPRCWRVGEPFEAHAKRYLPQIKPPLLGSAWLLNSLHITKQRRTAYDHYMLQLHDRAKADLAFQKSSPQQAVNFAPGTTWVVYSDQVLHAVHSGQHMMEQTFYLKVEDLQQPALSPLRTLERLIGRSLR